MFALRRRATRCPDAPLAPHAPAWGMRHAATPSALTSEVVGKPQTLLARPAFEHLPLRLPRQAVRLAPGLPDGPLPHVYLDGQGPVGPAAGIDLQRPDRGPPQGTALSVTGDAVVQGLALQE